MPAFPYQTDIELHRLRLDLRNPRLPTVSDSQKEAFEAVAAEQKGKLLALARHICERGLNPAQRFIVFPDDESSFIVLDANRRLAALKALEQPELMQAALSDTQIAALRKLASDYEPPDDVPCVVFATREDADIWVELAHEGQGDGSGLVEWTAQQKARHRARARTQPPHMQVLDFVIHQGKPSAAAAERNRKGTYPVSTLDRVLSTPYVRERLGIEVMDAQVVTNFPKAEVLKGLTKLVNEIGTGTRKVADFMSRADRERYIDAFKPSELPDAGTRTDASAPLDQAPEVATDKKPRQRDRQHSKARTKMIPADFSANIPVARINDIYYELKRSLKLSEVPNAIAVLFRVFVEFSIDDYIKRNLDPKKFVGKQLNQKQEAVLLDLEAKGLITKKAMIPLRESLKDPANVTLFTNLNAFVHNPTMTPSANDLRSIWERFAPLIELLWA